MLLLAVRHKARSTSTIWTHVFSIFSGDGRWRVALAWDPTHHTHVHMLLLPHRRSSDAPSAATSYSGWYSGTVRGTVRSSWYSMVQCGTVWYTRAAPPLTYAAAVWPQLSEEQQQLPRSGRLTHIHVSTYLRI